MTLETLPLGTETERDIVSGLPVRRLTDVPGMQFFFPYFTNNPFPRPDQIVCFGEPVGAVWDKLAPRTLFVADLSAGELRRVTKPFDSKNLWMAVCGLSAAREGDRAFWAVDDKLLLVDLLKGGAEEIYRSPEGWSMGQSNCTAAGDVFSVGETRNDFSTGDPKPDGYTMDSLAHGWPEPVSRIVLVDAEKAESKVVHEVKAVTSHVNVHPRDRNRVLFCHEGHWSYVGQRIWLLDVATGQAKAVCKPPKGYAFGHETWTDDGRILFHGANLQLKPEDRKGPQPPLQNLIGVGRAEGEIERMVIDPRMRWGLPHITMSPDGQWITTAGQWARDFVWVARWGGERLEPRILAAHHGEGASTICPRFLPDGSAVVFVGLRADTSQLYMVEMPD
jgi:hypothetical protein